jgi:hypothetical protein
MRTRPLIAAITIAAISLLAACGDNASNNSASKDSAAADTTAAAPDTTPGGATDTTVTGDTAGPAPTGPGKDTEFCKYQQELNDMTTPFDDKNSDAAAFEKYFKELVNPAIDKLQASAPPEIKDQMDLLAAGLKKFSAAFESNGWDPAKAYADPVLKELANDAAYNAAGTAVDAFCGF